ncbi:hypothetical protein GCM10010409_06060 [Mycolicibacterium diernhoferi]
MVREEFAKSQANNHSLTLRERLYWLAMWQAKPNGHATFEDGKVAEILTVAHPGGRIATASPRGIRKARGDAIKSGQLHQMSDANCLVLPADAVSSGLAGSDEPCRHCMAITPSPTTHITVRDYDSELLERESYKRAMTAQARAVL